VRPDVLECDPEGAIEMERATVEYCLFRVQAWCLPSDEWAAWVQAGGSILALLAVYLTTAYASRMREVEMAAAKAARLRYAAQLLADAAVISKGLAEFLATQPTGVTIRFEGQNLESINELVQRALSPDMPAESMHPLLMGLHGLLAISQFMRSINGEVWNGSREFLDAFSEVAAQINEAHVLSARQSGISLEELHRGAAQIVGPPS
jgi:hypothetical protein